MTPADRKFPLAASVFGLALAAAFPFLNYRPLWFVLEKFGRYSGLVVPVAVALVLCGVGFGVRRRTAAFYQIRGFGWRDLLWMLCFVVGMVCYVIVIDAVIAHLAPNADGGADGDSDDSRVMRWGYVGAIEAGVSEEFIYRGFMIEELGAIIRSRRIAAAFSVVVFGLIHGTPAGGYGWTWRLLIPLTAGAFLTWLYFWRKSLPLCMLAHAIFDSLSVANG